MPSGQIIPPEVKAAALEDYAAGITAAAVAKKYGLQASTIQSWARNAGMGGQKGRPKRVDPVLHGLGEWVYGDDGIARWVSQ